MKNKFVNHQNYEYNIFPLFDDDKLKPVVDQIRIFPQVLGSFINSLYHFPFHQDLPHFTIVSKRK